MKRLFLAIPISAELKSDIKKQTESLNLPLKWIPEKNFHVTLHFFGNMKESEIKNLIQKTGTIAENTSPFSLEANSLLIKSGKFQNMIWVGFKESFEFEKVAVKISRSMGMDTIRKPLPHINLARSKAKIKSEHLPLYFKKPHQLEVDHLELWESKLSPEGSTYFPLESFTLNGETERNIS